MTFLNTTLHFSLVFASHKNIIGPLLSHLRGKLVKQASTVSHEAL